MLGRPLDTVAVGFFDLVVIGMADTQKRDRESAQCHRDKTTTDFFDLAIAQRSCCSERLSWNRDVACAESLWLKNCAVDTICGDEVAVVVWTVLSVRRADFLYGIK